MPRVLKESDGPLVWIDCEMTGLDIDKDRLLEIAVLITAGDLQPIDAGVSYVIEADKATLDAMNEWCVNQHGKSGLTADCQNPSTALPLKDVRDKVMQYITSRIESPRVAVLAGNSVHSDKVFLKKEMPELVEFLHYRIVDVSTIKELVRRWYGPDQVWSGGKGLHRALEDIHGSIEELRHYRAKFFRDGPSA